VSGDRGEDTEVCFQRHPYHSTEVSDTHRGELLALGSSFALEVKGSSRAAIFESHPVFLETDKRKLAQFILSFSNRWTRAVHLARLVVAEDIVAFGKQVFEFLGLPHLPLVDDRLDAVVVVERGVVLSGVVALVGGTLDDATSTRKANGIS